MTLSSKQKRELRSKAHALKPVVLIGQKGFTEAVREEINLALAQHELIKIRIRVEEADDRKEIATQIYRQCQAQLIQSIGHVSVFYRKKPEEKKPKPKKTVTKKPRRIS